ncbi:MAG TPA: transporter [Bacteroidota bacterium]|nr:transporter [Bacteroidota bacterium]
MGMYDNGVIVVYFAFIILIGIVFHKFSKDSSDYFRGGGHMLWWLVGATGFMSQFSAWTFIGAAGKAYREGFLVLTIFFGNALGYLVTYLFSAAKFRQLRAVTTMEIIRDRFGKANEQFFTWLNIPSNIIYASIWLYSISTFVSVVFGWNIMLCIIGIGLVVIVLSSVGGAWAVSASDFMQMMILMPITIVAAIVAITAVGSGNFLSGAVGFVHRLPQEHFNWSAMFSPQLLYLWIFAALLKQVININNPSESYRFLFAKDSENARKGGLLASILFFVGPVLWFIPPMAAAILYPDLTVLEQLRPLGDRISEGAYVGMGLQHLPQGMIGLMVTAMFACTISNMDTGLNKNSGFFMRSFYMRIMRKNRSEKEYLLASRITTVVLGILIILTSIGLNQLKGLSLFALMINFSSMVAIPIAIPLIWGLVFRRAPSWAAWSTTLLGLLISLNVYYVLDPEVIRNLLGIAVPFTKYVYNEFYLLIASMLIGVPLMSAWFFVSLLFPGRNTDEYNRNADEVFTNMTIPVITDPEKTKAMDYAQLRMLSRLAFPYGVFVMLLVFIPNDLFGRSCFIMVGLMITVVGWLLHRAALKKAPAAA